MHEQYQIDIFNARKTINPDVYHFDIAALNAGMKNINEIRQENFRKLAAVHANGRLKDFAPMVGIQPAQASHLNTGFRNIGDSVAHRIENAFALPRGWMDREHPDSHTQGQPTADHRPSANEKTASDDYVPEVTLQDAIHALEAAFQRGSLKPEALKGLVTLLSSINPAPSQYMEEESGLTDTHAANLLANDHKQGGNTP